MKNLTKNLFKNKSYKRKGWRSLLSFLSSREWVIFLLLLMVGWVISSRIAPLFKRRNAEETLGRSFHYSTTTSPHSQKSFLLSWEKQEIGKAIEVVLEKDNVIEKAMDTEITKINNSLGKADILIEDKELALDYAKAINSAGVAYVYAYNHEDGILLSNQRIDHLEPVSID